jgi:predicted FMN-binding regulatory protein PaiB
VGKFKLSQNRSEADRLGVAAGLQNGDAPAREVALALRHLTPSSKETS